jgi:hypothetical protein
LKDQTVLLMWIPEEWEAWGYGEERVRGIPQD